MPNPTWSQVGDAFRKAFPATFKTWKETQTQAYLQWEKLEDKVALMFFPTGEGKSKTSLGLVRTQGYSEVVVIAPLRTHVSWKNDAKALGMTIRVETVQKFRRKETKYNPKIPIIIDEYHELGGRGADGFEKFLRMSLKYKQLGTPVIMASATPNYNDAERVFCLQVIGEKKPNRNYGNWLYENCNTHPNPFAFYPLVDEDRPFINHKNALEFLRSFPWTMYVEDKAEWKEDELILRRPDLDVFDRYGYSRRHGRIMNSDMQRYHKECNLQLVDDVGQLIHRTELEQLFNTYDEYQKWMVVCAHLDVAEAFQATFPESWLISGETKDYEVQKRAFIQAESGFLIGTTALSTGVDGLDKTCQAMLILDPIRGDASKTRQIIGRILPRGIDDGIERLVVRAKIQ